MSDEIIQRTFASPSLGLYNHRKGFLQLQSPPAHLSSLWFFQTKGCHQSLHIPASSPTCPTGLCHPDFSAEQPATSSHRLQKPAACSIYTCFKHGWQQLGNDYSSISCKQQMRHSTKHHRMHKDQKTKKLPLLTMLTASCSLQDRSAACPTKCATNCPQEASGTWGSTHCPASMTIPSWLTPFTWQTTEQFARENATSAGCCRRNKAGSSVLQELLSFQLPSPHLTAGEGLGEQLDAQSVLLLPPAPRPPAAPPQLPLGRPRWRGLRAPRGKSTNGLIIHGEAQR